MTTKHNFLYFISLWGLLLTGCTSDSALESYNRGMYQVNKSVDKYTLKPITQAYQAVTPDPLEHRVSNFLGNISEVNTLFSSMLQGKLHNAAVSSSRLVWNTTIGLGGLFDVATDMGLKSNPEDFGQTLRTWGLPTGPYVVLPILGPSTVTDTVGRVGDYVSSPVRHYDWNDHYPREGVTVLGVINTRAKLLELEKRMSGTSTDEYTFVKNAYLQKREALVRDGKVEETGEVDEAFDELFGD